jgi:hypothetical protein
MDELSALRRAKQIGGVSVPVRKIDGKWTYGNFANSWIVADITKSRILVGIDGATVSPVRFRKERQAQPDGSSAYWAAFQRGKIGHWYRPATGAADIMVGDKPYFALTYPEWREYVKREAAERYKLWKATG